MELRVARWLIFDNWKNADLVCFYYFKNGKEKKY